MKKLNITKEKFNSSKYFQTKYGKLKFMSESGHKYKTDKGNVIQFNEAREYVDDSSIEPETADEFIIFNDPDIFNQIASIQKKQGEKVQDQVKDGEINTKEIADAANKAANKTALATLASGVASSAINSATSIATSKAALGLAALAGYGKVVQKAGELGEKGGDAIGNQIGELQAKKDGYYVSDDDVNKAKDDYSATKTSMDQQLQDYSKVSNLGNSQEDKRAMYLAKQLQSGQDTISNGGNRTITRDQALDELKKNGYEINKDGIVNKITTAGGSAAASAAVGSATSGGMTMFGLGAATVGWIVAGVAAAAIITPYIYDKVRACTKTWMADIIAEVKFKADGKNYRCFYDLKENKWVLTYADVKWSSYMDNKLDQETIDEFFSSNFFQTFLNKCKQTFAMLFSTSRNEVVFKTLPEIKDAPKELKEILEKIYDNKGAITKNLFTGNHD